MMPLAYSEINEIPENKIKKNNSKRKTIKKRSNSKVETFLNSMNKKKVFK